VHVVATAGHVDHGKSTLVEALTGQWPDRLDEERRRGLTIELGYCWTTMAGVGEVAFVDVPGHERFVATTLAGLGPVPVALLVVAADDPWMPQAAEHLAALDALGVTHGVVAVTRSDLTDPRPAVARATSAVAATTLAGAAVVPVSARTEAGMPELRAALASVLRALPDPARDDDLRLWVDRAFTVTGVGTVVTGTLPSGTVTVGDRMVLVGHDGSTDVRVRGLQTLGHQVPAATGTARVAVAVGGDVTAQRGDVLVAAGRWETTASCDVELVAGPDIRLPRQPLLHAGSASSTVSVRPLDGAMVRLSLDRGLPLRIGDRLLLRDPGSRTIWGAKVLDPDPRPLARRGDAARAARRLTAGDPALLSTAVDRDGLVHLPRARRLGVRGTPRPDDVVDGDWVLSSSWTTAAATTLRDAVATHDRAHPIDSGLSLGAASRLLDLPDQRLVAAVVRPPLRAADGRVVLGHDVPAAVSAAAARLTERLAHAPFDAPGADELADLGLTPEVIAGAVRAGLVLRLGQVVLLPDAADRAIEALAGVPQPFTASAARRALGTSRRVALPLLEHLDRLGLTRRRPDDRRELA
jgi:selenocysteine-specific elongation factor